MQRKDKVIFFIARKLDYSTYVIGNIFPESLKPLYYGYNCFYYELIKSRYISREESVIKTRLLFWENRLNFIVENIDKNRNKVENEKENENKSFKEKDEVDKEASKDDKNKSNISIDPLTDLLLFSLKDKKLINIETLYRLLDFQLFDLEKKGVIKNIEELEVYAENTRSLQIYLNLNLLGIKEDKAYEIGSHIGRGIGIVDVLKRFPTLLKNHTNNLPKDIINKHIGSYDLLLNTEGLVNERFYDVVLEIAAYAKKHLEVGRNMCKDLPKDKNAHVAFLQTIEAMDWLLRLEYYNFNIFEKDLHKVETYKISKEIMRLGKLQQY